MKKLKKKLINKKEINFPLRHPIQKDFLKIVKFEKKKINKEDYLQSNTNPKIISSILIDEFKLKIVDFTNTYEAGAIIRMLYQNDLEFLEGDVINIKTSVDFPFNHLGNYFNMGDYFIRMLVRDDLDVDSLIKDLINDYVNNQLNSISNNLTFLVELDPL